MAAKRSFGIQAYVGTTAAGVLIADVLELTPPGEEVETIDTTEHDASNRYRTFISTLANLTEMSLRTHMSAAGITQARAVLLTDDQAFGVKFPQFSGPGPITMDFVGILTAVNPLGGAVDGKLEVELRIKPSGIVTYAGLS